MARNIAPDCIDGSQSFSLSSEQLAAIVEITGYSFSNEQGKEIEILCREYLIERDFERGEVEAGCAEELVLEGAVAQFAETVKEDGTGKGIASLALIEAGMARRRRSGLFSPSIVNSERSIRPISRSATARLWRPYRSRACR